MLSAYWNGQSIRAIDSQWEGRKEEMRPIWNKEAYCPACNDNIECRFGEIRIHYFAHCRQTNCPGSQDSLEHLKGKLLLYQFLIEKYEKTNATIFLEYYIEEIRAFCDILIESTNGKKWAIEFVADKTGREIERKIAYYKDKNIDVTWFLSSSRIIKHTSDRIRLKKIDRQLAKHTPLDKYYVSNWYETIVHNQTLVELPKENPNLKSIYSIDCESNKIFIYRGLRETECISQYEPGYILEGTFGNIGILRDNTWYLTEERDLPGKRQEAEKIAKELLIQRQRRAQDYYCVGCNCYYPESEMGYKTNNKGLCMTCLNEHRTKPRKQTDNPRS